MMRSRDIGVRLATLAVAALAAFAGALPLAGCATAGDTAGAATAVTAAELPPACFAPWFETGAKRVPLDVCRRVAGTTEALESGFTLFTPDAADEGLPRGYTATRALGALADGRHAVWAVHSGGGTGQFSTVLAVQVADDTVVIDAALPLGDRANGGIRDARVAAGTLMVARALTPFDLVDLLHRSLTGEDGSAGAAFGLRAYDDLPACAVCDVGQATYRVDADFRETLVGVSLDTEALQAHLEPRANDAALACLAAFAEPAFAAGPIPAEALPAAAQAYRARCIARP